MLLDWAEARARRTGSERLSQTISNEDRAAVQLLRSRGYEPFVTQWLLEIALAAEPAVPAPPPGITVRWFRPGDEQAAYRLTEDAFDEWQKRRKSYQEWARRTVERDTFAPALSPVAFAGDQMVGAVLSLSVPGSDEGYVERVAVRNDHRNRGSPACCCGSRSAPSTARAAGPAPCGRIRIPARWPCTSGWA